MFPTRRIITSGGDVFRDEHSIAFDGTDDNIRIPPIEYDVDGGTVSFVYWAKRANADNVYSILGHTSYSNQAYIRHIADGTVKIESDSNGDVANITPISTDFNWHHYVIACSSGTVTAYQDGVACSVSGNVNGNNLTVDTIGGQGTNGTVYEWFGNISEIAAYNITLSSNQAKQIYNGGEPFDHKNWAKTGNLTQWWRMGDGSLDDYNIIGDETDATKGAELSPNVTFDTNTTGWRPYNGDTNTLSRDTTIKHSGSGSLKVVFDAGNSGWVAETSSNISSVSANKVLVMEGWVYIPSGSYNGGDVFLTDGSGFSGATVEVRPSTGSSSVTDEWQFMKTIFLNSTDTSGKCYVHTSGTDPSENDIVYLDDIKIYHINGNAGVMLNMNAADFEGDTP